MATRRWWHLRRIDLLFGIGAIGFFSQIVRAQPSEVLVYASIALMGLPIVQRVDTQGGGPPPPPPPPPPPSGGATPPGTP